MSIPNGRPTPRTIYISNYHQQRKEREGGREERLRVSRKDTHQVNDSDNDISDHKSNGHKRLDQTDNVEDVEEDGESYVKKVKKEIVREEGGGGGEGRGGGGGGEDEEEEEEEDAIFGRGGKYPK